MKTVVFRVRKIYFDQIVNGSKNFELRKISSFWDARLKDIPKMDDCFVALFLCGKRTHRRKIIGVTVLYPEDVLGRPLSEQGRKDIPTEKCFAVWLGEVVIL